MSNLIERLPQLIVHDNAILFVGAGLRQDESQPSVAQQIADALALRIEYGRPDRSLPAVARDFQVLQGRNALIQALRDELERLQKELEEAKAEAARHLDQLQRSQAEFANYKKRNGREREDFIKLANAALVSGLLPILDDYERALQTVPDNLRNLTWVEGIFLIERRLRMTLEEEGLREIEAVGKKFDPELHQAMTREETTEYEEDEIISEFQKGYKLHDRVLRPTMARVAAKPSENNRIITEKANKEDNYG